MTGMELLSSTEVCRRAAISYRQLTWWFEHGFAVPANDVSGQGRRRLWSAHEAEVLGRMAALVRLGLTLEAARAAAEDPWAFAERFVDAIGGPAPTIHAERALASTAA